MITVEHEGLTSAATGLAGSAAVPGAPSCVPPAADPVSGGVAGMFNAHSAGVSALLVARLAAGGVQRVLARDFGVRQSTVRKVKREAANRKAS